MKQNTRAGYRNILDYHLIPEFGMLPVSQINAAMIDKFIAGLHGSRGTARNVLWVLSPVMQHAVKARMITVNPVGAANRPKVAQSKNGAGMRFLTPGQVSQLADEIDTRYRTLVYTAAYTGLRAGELAALCVRHVDLLHGTLRVEDSVADVNGYLLVGRTKTEESRTVAIPAFLVPMLAEQVGGRGPSEYVFGSSTPLRHRNFYMRHFRPAVRRLIESPDQPEWPENPLGKLRFHDLRHTAAALMIDLGVHPKAIADRLGHSDIGITMNRYGHLYPGKDAEVADKLDKLFTAQPAPDAEVRLLPQRP